MKQALLIICILLGLAQGNNNYAQTITSGKSLLWKISGKEMRKPSYLFGTIHMICKDKYVWTKTMKKSLETSDEICMEMDMDDPSILMQIASAMIETNGKKLEDYFTEADYKLVEQYFRDSLGVNIDMFASMKPYVLETLLTSTASSCDSVVSYEVKISEAAKELDKEITGLETASEQIKLLEQLPVDSIIKELIEVAKGQYSEQGEYDALIKAYTSQDLPELYNLILKSKAEGDNLNAFLDERNEKWVDRMAERMDQKSVFFAVGAGHLWGEKGVINLLRLQGYTVEALR